MASTKSKEKHKKKNKVDKSSTGKEKEKEELKSLSPDEKMAYLLEHGHMVKDKLFNEVLMKKRRLEKEALAIGPRNLMSTTGKLRQNNRHNLKFMNQILMNEFNITDTANKQDKQNNKQDNQNNEQDNQNNRPRSRDNNNDTELSNQNNAVTGSKDNPKEKEGRKTSGDTNETHQGKITIEIDLSTPYTNTAVSSEEAGHKKTSKTKETNKNKLNSKDKEKLEKYTKNMLATRLTKLKRVKLSNGVVLSMERFECDHCHKIFNTKSCVRRHMFIHLDKRPFACDYCTLKFRQSCNLTSHMKKVHGPTATRKKYICHKCNKSFLLKENLTLHQASHIRRETEFKCVFCDKYFSNHLLLTQHEIQHMKQGRFKCAICTMSYDSRSRYSLHVKSHLEVKDLCCQYCSKQFLRPSSLKRHVEICHGGIRVQCHICKKKLRGHLTEHLRTHENTRPHECTVCGQRFTQSTQLNVHKRQHTGSRPYPCRICKRPFTHSNALMLHIRRHTGEKPFSCALCPMAFSQLPHMKCHMRRIHGREKFYKCGNCTAFFKLKTELEKHEANCLVIEQELTFEEEVKASLERGAPAMSISKMRFLLALLFTMIASKEKLKFLGFNKRLIDDILVEAVEAMGHAPCKDPTLTPLLRLKSNIAMLLQGTVPKDQMVKFKKSNKTTEELLELLTGEKNRNIESIPPAFELPDDIEIPDM